MRTPDGGASGLVSRQPLHHAEAPYPPIRQNTRTVITGVTRITKKKFRTGKGPVRSISGYQ